MLADLIAKLRNPYNRLLKVDLWIIWPVHAYFLQLQGGVYNEIRLPVFADL